MNLKVKQFLDVYAGRVLLAVNLIAVRGLGLLLKRNHTLSRPPAHVLVIKILGLGSVIMASDAIYSMRKKYPQARFNLICGKGVAAGIEPTKLFDEIWVIDDSSAWRLFTSSLNCLIKSWKCSNRWVVDLEVYSVLTTILSAWTGALNRFGFQLDKTHFRNYLNTHNVYFNQFVRVGLNYWQLAEAMGVKEQHTFHFPAQYTESDGRDTVFINNTCSELGGDLRKLTPELLHQICTHVLHNTSYMVALVGAPSDAATNNLFIQKYQLPTSRVKNLAGQLSFDAYYKLMGTKGKCMLSIDSAPLHIAQKLRLPVFSFWGPINPAQRISDSSNTYYLNKACSPCIHHTEVIPCGGNNICMKDMVLADFKAQLNQLLN